MNVIVLQVFVSLLLVSASILLFLHSMKQADHEHADRLSLFPIEQEKWPRNADEPTSRSRRKNDGPRIEEGPAATARSAHEGGTDPPPAEESTSKAESVSKGRTWPQSDDSRPN